MKRNTLTSLKGFLTACTVLICAGLDQSRAEDKDSTIYLNQAWTPQQRADYYWSSQGSALISYDIYLALQLPGSKTLFNSPSHADKVGLLMDPPDFKNNPDGLPIGISKTTVTTGQYIGVYMGMTCAACHTGQIQYKGKQIRIDGGVSNRIDLVSWMRSLAVSLNETVIDPVRFETMLKTIQKSNPVVSEADLKRRLLQDTQIVHALVNIQAQVKQPAVVPSLPGPGRMDALGSIHNSFTAINTGELGNVYPTLAPVKPPFLWNAPQSAWVQWSGFVSNPLSRNMGQILGVFARYDLKSATPEQGLFDSTSDVKGLVKLESLLKGLAPPQWPEKILGQLDQEKVVIGQKLFAKNCTQCHSSYPYRWSRERAPGKRFIENAMVPQAIVGTDNTQLRGVSFNPDPVISTGSLAPYFNGKAKVSSAEFNQIILGKIIAKAVNKVGPFSKEEFAEMNNYTVYSNNPPSPPPKDSYKAAPRDGVWATGPFLHNGSVPTIYDLLSPAAERPTSFFVTREFDPVKLGINTAVATSKDYFFDTTLVGNSNRGHSFEKSYTQTRGNGVIGPELTSAERFAIIEYLKSIPNEPGRVTNYGGPAKPLIASEDKTWFNFKRPYNGQEASNYVRPH